MKKTNMILPVLVAALVLCFLAGCSADALMDTGKALGNLGHATIDKGGDELVNTAVQAVAGFIEEYESYIDYKDVTRTVDESGKETIEGSLQVYPSENMEKITSMVDNLTATIIRAKESSSDDSALRAELDTPYSDYNGVKRSYKGQTIDWYCYKNLQGVANSSSTVGMLINMAAGFGANLTPILSFEIPLPIQVGEVLVPLTGVAPKMMAHLNFFKKIGEGGGSGKIKVDDFKYILDGMKKYVGGRTYETVGDKIAWCMVFELADSFANVLNRYLKAYPDEKDKDGIPTYESLNAQFILGKCETELDRVMSCLEVLGYIYDFNIDAAGLAGKLL